jgi:hypothetical protein
LADHYKISSDVALRDATAWVDRLKECELLWFNR